MLGFRKCFPIGGVIPKRNGSFEDDIGIEYSFLESVLVYVHEVFGCEGKKHKDKRCEGAHTFNRWSWEQRELIVQEFARR